MYRARPLEASLGSRLDGSCRSIICDGAFPSKLRSDVGRPEVHVPDVLPGEVQKEQAGTPRGWH